jgi:hypothetical protein
MSLLRNIADGLRALFRKEQVSQELDEELNSFLEMAAEEKMKQGNSRKGALRTVRLERGNLEVTKEAVRSAHWETQVSDFVRDIHFALRHLRKDRRFALVAILVLALGIGASTAIFSVVNAALLCLCRRRLRGMAAPPRISPGSAAASPSLPRDLPLPFQREA